jgi:hypothetical protein
VPRKKIYGLSLLIKFNVGVGVVWIVAGTIWTASDLCIAIGMVTVKGRTR